MFVYLALPIYVNTVFYDILLYLSLCRSDIASPYIYIFLILFLYLDVWVLSIYCEIVRYYMLDIAALSELEAQAFHHNRNNIC